MCTCACHSSGERCLASRQGTFLFIVFQFVVHLSPHCSPLPHASPIGTVSLPPIVHTHESSIHVPLLDSPLLSPVIPFPPPLWSLSVCSLFPSLCFYFAHLFVLLIRFHLQVRSHGISLSLPGSFYFV